MEKEVITLSGIKDDLGKVAFFNILNEGEWRLAYILPITALAIIVGAFLKSILLALLIFSVAAYHIVEFIIQTRNYQMRKKAIKELIDRGDISIAVEHLSHIVIEQVYEPHRCGSRVYKMKDVTFFCFDSVLRWRVPDVNKHYEWSKEYYVSSKGLENISVQGNEFFYISLQGHHNIAYIYPCKCFVLDESLRRNTL